MTYQEFTLKFNEQALSLHFDRGLRLAITIAKELFPDYKSFAERHCWGDTSFLTKAIAICESSTLSGIDRSAVESVAAKLYSVIPDTEDFGDWDGSLALNAAACAYDLLQFLLDRKSIHLSAIGTYYTDTIDIRIHQMGFEVEEEIDNHPLMQSARSTLLHLSS